MMMENSNMLVVSVCFCNLLSPILVLLVETFVPPLTVYTDMYST